MTVTWYRHNHENRNDLLRFGLMRMHYAGEIDYKEKPLSEGVEAGIGARILDHPDKRHVSFLQVKQGACATLCLVDTEDSFALVTPLIAEVDVAFCTGYNHQFFAGKQFVTPYTWQTEADVAWYRRTMEEKLETIGEHFHKVKPFVPIGPAQGTAKPVSKWVQKKRNLLHRINQVTERGLRFADDYTAFELREAQMDELRQLPLRYDVVLNDSLWGWPQHRIALHHRLQALHQGGHRIHSILNYTEPSVCDGSTTLQLDRSSFPITTGPINQSYEAMLASSRLGVFACGFHWGWRNIVMLALRTGIPVLTDRLLTEPYFDITAFYVRQQETADWGTLKAELTAITNADWHRIKAHNQAVYDRYMRPDAVARYFLQAATNSFRDKAIQTQPAHAAL